MEQKDKDNKPIIPTLKDSQKPQLKIKGLAQGGLSLIERLKQFKKKDLAFIMAGLGVLFMAPLAEHFMMAPENGEGAFKEGWGFRDGAGGLGKGSSPYEAGLNGLAPGTMAGTNGDVITPLNVRDPSALIMGPSASVQPPAGGPAAPTAPAKTDSGDWKDALTQSAATAGKAAAKKVSLPTPKVALSGGGLRGMGALAGGGGGGGGGGGSGPISSQGLGSGKPSNGGSLGLSHAASGFKGVAARGADSGAGGSFDALKKAADNAASQFNRTGSAGSALQAAANTALPGGDANGGSGGGAGGGDKAPGNNNLKDSKSLGESLEFLRLKAEQDHSIDLEWKLKEEAAMRWPKLEDKMLEEIVMTPLKGLTGAVSKAITNGFTGGGSVPCSYTMGGNTINVDINVGSLGKSCNQSTAGSDGTATDASSYYSPDGTSVYTCQPQGTPVTCGGSTPKPTTGGPQSTTGSPTLNSPAATPGALGTGPSPLTAGSSNNSCSFYAQNISGNLTGGTGVAVTRQAGVLEGSKGYAGATQNLNNANAALTGDNPQSPKDCAGYSNSVDKAPSPKSVRAYLNEVRDLMVGPGKTDGSVDNDNSVLGWLKTTNDNAGAVLVKVISKDQSTAFEHADQDFQTAYKANATDPKLPDPLAKALQTAYGNVAPLVNTLDSSQVKSDPSGKLGQMVTTARQDITAARANMDAADKLLGAGEGLKNQNYNVDPGAAGQYTKAKGSLDTDFQNTRTAQNNLKQALDLVDNAVAGVEQNLQKGVDDNATKTKGLVRDNQPSVKQQSDDANLKIGAAVTAGDSDAATAAETQYTANSTAIQKPLLAQLAAQQKLSGNTGSTDGNTAAGGGTTPAPTSPKDMSIAGAIGNFKSAVGMPLTGSAGAGTTTPPPTGK
jgi:hypothetical protein